MRGLAVPPLTEKVEKCILGKRTVFVTILRWLVFRQPEKRKGMVVCAIADPIQLLS
jgi:hypothetical protein